ncbi:hypothetical protein [Halorubellus salinus]|uniref:hypothetical protein n=1 Tax=Halorubellus salinus TaxID=755309 RepID=UPI001D08225C|nr:hypothetical protein [Halorubellus salinus]
MATYQVRLSNYTDELPEDDEEVDKFLVTEKETRADPLERVISLLLELRDEFEAKIQSAGGMSEVDLPHTFHPPNLLPKQELGYRLINHWEDALKEDSRVDESWLEKTREVEKSREYGMHFVIEIITLHIEVGPIEIRLIPDGADEVCSGEDTLWGGDFFKPEPTVAIQDQIASISEE